MVATPANISYQLFKPITSISVAADRQNQPNNTNNPNNPNNANDPNNQTTPPVPEVPPVPPTPPVSPVPPVLQVESILPASTDSRTQPVSQTPSTQPFLLVPLTPIAPSSRPTVRPVASASAVGSVPVASGTGPISLTASVPTLSQRGLTGSSSFQIPEGYQIAPGFQITPTSAPKIPSGYRVPPGYRLTPDDGPPPPPPYDPFVNRQVEYPTSQASSTINLLKACLGTGILAMPVAFKNAGLVLGTIGIIMAGSVVTHTIHVLVRTSQEVCVDAEMPAMSFSETCGAAFTYGPKRLQFLGHFIEHFADISLSLCYTGVLCIYVVFIAESLKQVADSFIVLPTVVFCGVVLLPLILICQVKSLKYVTPFSAIANIGIVVVFSITLKYIFTNLPGVCERKMIAPMSTWPLFISTAVFAIEGIGVVMPVENEMAEPQKFLACPGVLSVTMSIVVFLYGFVGFMGYLKYGDFVKGSITLNLPQDSFFAQFTKFLMAVVIFFTYTLQFYVPMEAINRRFHIKKIRPKSRRRLIEIGIRAAVVTGSVIVAALVPNLEIVISLVGSIFFSTCGIMLPVIAETVYRWDRDLGRHSYIMWKNLLILIMGISVLVSGTQMSLSHLNDVALSEDDYEYDTA